MAITYGIEYPFMDSERGDYLRLTKTPEKEIRSNLIHLLLTRKGTRYFMPDFGTRLYEYIFNQNDVVTYNLIEEEIREGVKKYIPNLEINKITISNPENEINNYQASSEANNLFKSSDSSQKPYTAKVRIDYSINNGTFSSSDFVIINI
jgi:phage baseplate assembly protein W